MPPETQARDGAGPDANRDLEGEIGGATGVPPLPTPSDPQPDEVEGGRGSEGPDVPADEDGGTGEVFDVDPEDPAGAGNRSPEGGRGNTRISRQTFRAACIAGNGNRAHIARALGCTHSTISRRIAADPELNALFGDAKAEPAPPNENQVMNRTAEDLPRRVAVEIGHIDQSDLSVYRNALRAYGVSEKRLSKLKALDGLAKDWATHLSISLRGHHQSYDGQLHNLAELADEISEKMLGIPAGDGTYTPLDAESYTDYAKLKVECVKEAGKGVATMLALTEALVRMMTADKGKGAPAKATAGWGPMKKVRPPEASHASD